jgi:hypothetical protein
MKQYYVQLVLLWNEYQTLGYSPYTHLFKRILAGKCPVSNCRYKNMHFISWT